MANQYGLEKCPPWQFRTETSNSTLPMWSGVDSPPELGTEVWVSMNGLGRAWVTSYFVEHGYLGIKVSLVNPPAWFVKQNKGDRNCHVFGIDLLPKKEAMDKISLDDDLNNKNRS